MPFRGWMTARAALMLLVSCAAFGQSVPPSPEFEVADVRANHSGLPGIQGGILPGGQVSVRNIPMKELIMQAYKAGDVAGGPGWLDFERFDIAAKAPPGTSEDTLRLMLQRLLADRFQLAIHRERKAMPVYALIAARKRPGLRPAQGAGQPACHPGRGSEGLNHTACTNFTMADLASWLSTRIAPSYIELPVADHTGLPGHYDFQLDWAPRQPADSDAAAGPTVFDALDRQLGLKLEKRKEPTPIIVIDRIERIPTGN